MRMKLTMYSAENLTVEQCFQRYLLAVTGQGVAEKTLQTYHGHFRSLSKYLDTTIPISQLTKTNVDMAVAGMRAKGLSINSISSYIRTFRSFLNWCRTEGYCGLSIPAIKPRRTVKQTYTDEELERLLEKPDSNCSFCEYRSWVIVQFLLNSGCRAATVRNIQIQDVNLDGRQVTFRHTKTGIIQVIPLGTTMTQHLRAYMRIRGGEPSDYLFCSEHGEMLTESALRLSIVRYNTQRGVSHTSIHMFRHTFARKYLIDCGGNAFTLQKLLGHSTLEMTKRYCAVFNTDITNGFDNISPLEQLQSKRKARIDAPKGRRM